MTMEVGSKSGYTQEIFNQIDQDYQKKTTQFDESGDKFAIDKSRLEFRIWELFSDDKKIDFRTGQQFATEIEKYQGIREVHLRTMDEAKKLQQKCNIAKMYLKPSLSVETLESIKEVYPDLYKEMLEDSETCRNYFIKLNEYENKLFSQVKYMELQHKEFESSLRAFQEIANNKEAIPALSKIETKGEQSELSFEQQIANAEALATTNEELDVKPEITTSSADQQRSNLKTANKYLKRVSPHKRIAEIIHSLREAFNHRRK